MAYIITCTYLYSTFYEIAEMFHYGFLPLKIEGGFFFNKSEFEQLLLFHKNTWQLFDRVWTSQTHKIWGSRHPWLYVGFMWLWLAFSADIAVTVQTFFLGSLCLLILNTPVRTVLGHVC